MSKLQWLDDEVPSGRAWMELGVIQPVLYGYAMLQKWLLQNKL